MGSSGTRGLPPGGTLTEGWFLAAAAARICAMFALTCGSSRAKRLPSMSLRLATMR